MHWISSLSVVIMFSTNNNGAAARYLWCDCCLCKRKRILSLCLHGTAWQQTTVFPIPLPFWLQEVTGCWPFLCLAGSLGDYWDTSDFSFYTFAADSELDYPTIKLLLWCATRSPLPVQGKQKRAYFERWLKLSAYQVKTQNALIILFESGFRSTPLHMDYFWDIWLSHWCKFYSIVGQRRCDWRALTRSYFFIFNIILDAGQFLHLGSFWHLILGIPHNTELN